MPALDFQTQTENITAEEVVVEQLLQITKDPLVTLVPTHVELLQQGSFTMELVQQKCKQAQTAKVPRLIHTTPSAPQTTLPTMAYLVRLRLILAGYLTTAQSNVMALVQ